MFPIKPNEDRVIVKPETLADKTEGGLWIPDTAKGNPKKGVVLAVGEGRACPHCGKPHTPMVAIGDTVTFPESAGTSYKIGGEDILVIRSTDIQLYGELNK